MVARKMNISISFEVETWLESYSKVKGISIADAIEVAIQRLKEDEDRDIYQTLLSQTCGIWKKGDGLKYQETLRSEWER